MARLNVRDTLAGGAVGLVAAGAARFGARVPVIGAQLATNARPIVGAAAIVAHLLAPPRLESQFGTAGAAAGGAALLGDFLTTYVLARAGIPAYAGLAHAQVSPLALSGPAVDDLLDGGPSARGRVIDDMGRKTVRVDM